MSQKKKNHLNLIQAPSLPGSFLYDRQTKKRGTKPGQLFVLGEGDFEGLAQLLTQWAPVWKRKLADSAKRELYFVETTEGPLWIVFRRRPQGPFSHQARLEETDYSWFRDSAGTILTQAKSLEVDVLHIQFRGTEPDMERGFLVGLELAAYSYKAIANGKCFEGFPEISLKKDGQVLNSKILSGAVVEGQSINLARHLVNLPPNTLNPSSLSEFVQKKFPKNKNVKLSVWNHQRLEREGMGLHLAVGRGAEHPPCLVHIRYRGGGKKSKPLAFVGKGITFDTGGLDLKPSSAMRLMKKDMGGAAAVLGLALYAILTKIELNLDFYLALAENSVSARSFRPSDVVTARNGLTVEIHNTDAEGRLVLADALDVAATQTGLDEPAQLVDVATLTGAIKLTLGTEIAGLFSNHDELADDLHVSGSAVGDLNWRIPLYSRYASNFSSPFADMVNAVDGMGGPITAALFLEKFVRNKPWAHFDLYAWADRASGSLMSAGGNGQGVQCLIEYLKLYDQKAHL